MAARIIQGINPDAVISGNTPTEAQGAILKACKAQDIRFVYWLQDVFSVAVSKLVTKELGFLGKSQDGIINIWTAVSFGIATRLL